MNKTFNNKAWWMVLPVFLVVAFNALVPLDDCCELFGPGNLRQQ